MKTIISVLTAMIIVCLPKMGFSDPACINGNVSIWQYDQIPLVQIITTGMDDLSMDNFDDGAEYKILVTQDAPNIAQNVQFAVGLYAQDSGSVFVYSDGQTFDLSYYIPLTATPGQSQLLKFAIYKHVLGLWDWQTTFYYYVNTTCTTNANLTQGAFPLFAKDYEVSGNLTVSSSVSPGSGIAEFDGGSSVTLLPGFITSLGTGAVLAIIDGCGGSYRLANTMADQSKKEEAIMSEAEKITVYPNPANDLISVAIPTASAGDKIRAEIRDINGRLLYTEDYLYDQNKSFDLKPLKPGLYFITISGTGISHNQKIVKQ